MMMKDKRKSRLKSGKGKVGWLVVSKATLLMTWEKERSKTINTEATWVDGRVNILSITQTDTEG